MAIEPKEALYNLVSDINVLDATPPLRMINVRGLRARSIAIFEQSAHFVAS